MKDYSQHVLYLELKGKVSVTSNIHTIKVKQGREAIIPSLAAQSVMFVGKGNEALIGIPFEVIL